VYFIILWSTYFIPTFAGTAAAKMGSVAIDTDGIVFLLETITCFDVNFKFKTQIEKLGYI
jgi:hypothetical protein